MSRTHGSLAVLLTVSSAIWGGTPAAADESRDELVARWLDRGPAAHTAASTQRYVSVLAKDASAASLSIASTTVSEGDSGTASAIFTVSLSAPLNTPTKFSYRTVDRTATSGADYQEDSGQGSIPAGKTTTNVEVSVSGDKEYEQPDESFVLELTSVTNPKVSIAEGEGICTIVDDDPRPRFGEPTGDDALSCWMGGTRQLTVEVVDHQTGELLPGSPVFWSVKGEARLLPAGAGGEGRKCLTVPTDAAGKSSVTVTCGSAGSSLIQAELAGDLTQLFKVSVPVVLDPMSLDPVAGSVAEALNVICPRNDLGADLRMICDAVAASKADQLNDELRQLAPEEAAAQLKTMGEAVRVQQRNVEARLANLHAAAIAIEREDENTCGYFVNGSLGMGDRPATVQENGFDLDTHDITTGIDCPLFPEADQRRYVGGAIGYHSTRTRLADNGGGLETRGASLSAYATYVSKQPGNDSNIDHAFHLDAVVTYGRSELEIRRNIDFANLSPRIARAAPDSDQFALSLGGSRSWKWLPPGARAPVNDVTIRGLGRIDYLEATIDGYDEQGAGGFNLALDEQELTSLLASAGVQLSLTKYIGRISVEPMIRLDARHELEDDSRPIEARFIEDPGGTSFIVRTDEPDRNYLNLRLDRLPERRR